MYLVVTISDDEMDIYDLCNSFEKASDLCDSLTKSWIPNNIIEIDFKTALLIKEKLNEWIK